MPPLIQAPHDGDGGGAEVDSGVLIGSTGGMAFQAAHTEPDSDVATDESRSDRSPPAIPPDPDSSL